MSSSKLTKQAIRQLSHMAERYGLTLDAERIAGLPARIFTKYGGAQVLQKILRDASIATVQCGADGKWLAVLPLDLGNIGATLHRSWRFSIGRAYR